MVLKGNLLYNGDFETGTTEGWINGAYGKPGQLDFTVSAEAKYSGNYGGLLTATDFLQTSFLAYNEKFSFEEYEAFLYILPVKMVKGICVRGVLYGLDDKGSLIDYYRLGFNNEEGSWRVLQMLLRGFGRITHFEIGLITEGSDADSKFYFDEVKLIPLRSIKGHALEEYVFLENLTVSATKYAGIVTTGRGKLVSHVKVANVSGTSPTLDISLKIYTLRIQESAYSFEHTQFTDEGVEVKEVEVTDISIIKIDYNVGGDSPSFNVYHQIRLIPL